MTSATASPATPSARQERGAQRRVKLLRLTPHGRSVRTELGERVAAGSSVGSRLTGPERRRLAALLETLLG